MAQNIKINGVTYNSVSSLSIPLNTGGGNAIFPDTSDATAVAGDIASGKTAYVDGSKVTGTAAGGGTYQSKTVTPSASQQSVTPDTGYDALSSVTVSGDADLTAANIKKDVVIFGVTGTLESGGGTTVYTITKAGGYDAYCRVPAHGVPGDTICLTKYALYGITSIKDASNNTISYAQDALASGGAYYFTMPSSNVTITLHYNDF